MLILQMVHLSSEQSDINHHDYTKSFNLGFKGTVLSGVSHNMQKLIKHKSFIVRFSDVIMRRIKHKH